MLRKSVTNCGYKYDEKRIGEIKRKLHQVMTTYEKKESGIKAMDDSVIMTKPSESLIVIEMQD